MKKFLLVILILLSSSFASINEHYQILNHADFDMARNDNLVSAISWPQDDGSTLESFNKWQCYSIDQIKSTNAVVEDHYQKCVPSIEVSHPGTFTQYFDIDVEEDWDCEAVLLEWDELIKNQKSICLYGAFTQFQNPGFFFWDLVKIKTENGYWDRSVETGKLQHKKDELEEASSF